MEMRPEMIGRVQARVSTYLRTSRLDLPVVVWGGARRGARVSGRTRAPSAPSEALVAFLLRLGALRDPRGRAERLTDLRRCRPICIACAVPAGAPAIITPEGAA